MTNVKWLTRITAVSEPFVGYQQATGDRLRATADDPGAPVTRMMPRALMVPPGIPDFLSRRRVVTVGRHEVIGRAWSGWGPIRTVEVSADGGATWADAAIEDGPSPWAWSSWSFTWQATEPGEIELRCRDTDLHANGQHDGPALHARRLAHH